MLDATRPIRAAPQVLSRVGPIVIDGDRCDGIAQLGGAYERWTDVVVGRHSTQLFDCGR